MVDICCGVAFFLGDLDFSGELGISKKTAVAISRPVIKVVALVQYWQLTET